MPLANTLDQRAYGRVHPPRDPPGRTVPGVLPYAADLLLDITSHRPAYLLLRNGSAATTPLSRISAFLNSLQ